jgi:hypothetical protein
MTDDFAGPASVPCPACASLLSATGACDSCGRQWSPTRLDAATAALESEREALMQGMPGGQRRRPTFGDT